MKVSCLSRTQLHSFARCCDKSISCNTRLQAKEAIDQHPAKILDSVVPITCTTYCFQGQGDFYVTIPTNFPGQSKTFFGIGAGVPLKKGLYLGGGGGGYDGMYVLFTYRWAYNQGQRGSFISEKQKNLTLISVIAWNTAASHRSLPVGRRKLTTAEIDNREAAVFAGYVSHLFWNGRRSIPSLDYPQRCIKCSQPTFRHAITGFFAKWHPRNERRNSILMTRHYPTTILLPYHPGSASD